LVEELLDYIPDDRIEDVIYINAADTERPVLLNPLENVDPAYHPVVASGVISLLKKIWGDSWDPRCPFHKSCASLDPLKIKGFRTLATSKSGSEFTKWTSSATRRGGPPPAYLAGAVSGGSSHADG
jgi:hypothetical protein